VTRYVALLRAINTPPRYVTMQHLVSVFADLGLEGVSTVIASGNVVFNAPPSDVLAARIEHALSGSLGFDVPVYLRSSDEIAAIVDSDPFGVVGGTLEVSFLPGVPDPANAARLAATVTGTDRLDVIGREVYWWRAGDRSESRHRESTTVKILGMQTTRRSARTVERISAALRS